MRTVGSHVAAWVRSSAIYAWLTAEPDPEVIVIDLRETWTVGPFLKILDWVIDFLIGAMGGSIFAKAAGAAVSQTRETPLRVGGGFTLLAGLALFLVTVAGDAVSTTLLVGALVVSTVGAVGLRDRRSWGELRDTRVVELLIRALEPPAPPEGADGSAASDGSVVSSESSDPDGPSLTERDASSSDAESDPVTDDAATTADDPEPTLFPDDPSDPSDDTESTLFPDDSVDSSDNTKSESTRDDDRS
ncbi:hypothetical protein SAMN04488066_104121 [Halorubrum aquaticum]|uniref:Uncharacterized protein n=1 Tax=Halorubrum aquaticum TaxID=387340 RepID=A0A1I3A3Q4_9EURY|nr:hypothetical protein [Halorubrum aquaticum]SFH44737.1 hypothetical protein SAMN04488066_104121 [Halorubrum aquaticum]